VLNLTSCAESFQKLAAQWLRSSHFWYEWVWF